MKSQKTGGLVSSRSAQSGSARVVIAGSELHSKAALPLGEAKVRLSFGVDQLVERMTSKQATVSFTDIEVGLRATVAREAESQGLSRDDIRMIIPDRTLDRRIAEGAPLKLGEADGIARLLRVVSHARRVFNDNAVADEWLRTANPALGNHIPIQMARSDLGGREVEAELGRIEHGVFG